ncbi:MAG: hypothetical protein ACPGTQ_10620 [Colwellia sp.]
MENTIEKSSQVRFIKHFMMSMVLFLVLIAVQTFAIELYDLSTFMKVVFTLLPALALVWAFLIYKERYNALDEYLKAKTSTAFLWTLGLVCVSSFIYGMLAMKFPLPPVELALVTPIVFGSHGIILEILIRNDNE